MQETIDSLAQSLFESGSYELDKCKFVAEGVYNTLSYDYGTELNEKKDKLLLVKDLCFDSLDYVEMIFFLEENLEAPILDPLFHRYEKEHGRNFSVLHVMQMSYESMFG